MKRILEFIECICLFAIIYMHKDSIADAIITAVITFVFGVCAFIEGMYKGENGGRDDE